jgi:hypothetical protein
MTWMPLLLADPSPSLRLRVLRELLQRDEEDEEVQELRTRRPADPLVTELLATQADDGSWPAADGNRLKSTALALARLAYLGLAADEAAVAGGAAYLFAQQQADGSWPLPAGRTVDEETATAPKPAREGYTMIPLQTALPLRGLAAAGYATDPRAERAYDWLLAQRLDDGAWPTGLAAGGVYGYVAGYRRIGHSRWGCRANTTGALVCLALHPERRHGAAAQRGLDLLLGRDTQESYALGFDLARLLGWEPPRGFITYYAHFDPAQILNLCGRIGAQPTDERVRDLVNFVQAAQGPYGLWAYAGLPQATRWLTFDLLGSLSRLDAGADASWVALEPRTPFQSYPMRRSRY